LLGKRLELGCYLGIRNGVVEDTPNVVQEQLVRLWKVSPIALPPVSDTKEQISGAAIWFRSSLRCGEKAKKVEKCGLDVSRARSG
jgi:hypothetical protein